ncbi:hypothetical protein [unidentified bacterial endosymbiont]|uniref:hypothetical protein n=1 Tax=unidentified bacterial endosymbiont TaxID=2355 RepID=UPI00209DC2E5|nr:hypothetical protein [unidentified bacterial endosymbiont]
MQTEKSVLSPQTSNGITQCSWKNHERIAQDLDYVIYAMPVIKDKNLREKFLNPLVNNDMIPQNFIFKPLENSELKDALAIVGFTPKKDDTGQVRPGVYFNESYKGTIEVSSRTTKAGDTEWNIFFKGVDTRYLKATVANATKNICMGLKKNATNVKKFLLGSSQSPSQTHNINNNQVTGATITDQMTEDENRNNTSSKTATESQHRAKNYQAVEKIMKFFIEVAERTQEENNEKIILTIAGHSMGGGLAQTALAAYHDKIHLAYTFQAMDTKEEQVAEKIKNNPEIALKLRDFHTNDDPVTGAFKEIRNSERIKDLAVEHPEIRKTVDIKKLEEKHPGIRGTFFNFFKNPIEIHQNFIDLHVTSIIKSNTLMFSKPINSGADKED